MKDIFNEISELLSKNEGRNRYVFITLKDGSVYTILAVYENNAKKGSYTLTDTYLRWNTINNSNFTEIHYTDLDSIMDVSVKVVD